MTRTSPIRRLCSRLRAELHPTNNPAAMTRLEKPLIYAFWSYWLLTAVTVIAGMLLESGAL